MAAAGPLVNGALGLTALTALALLLRNGVDPQIAGVEPLWILGLLNVVLCLFNLIPIAPLDGSAIVGSFLHPYGRFIRDPANAKYTWMAFGIVFLMAGELFRLGAHVANAWVGWVVGL